MLRRAGCWRLLTPWTSVRMVVTPWTGGRKWAGGRSIMEGENEI